VHNLDMKSRVYPTYKTKYHVANWPEYERALVQRGDVTLWISADATDVWHPAPSGQPGGQQKFSDQAIETALTLRPVFRLPLRQAEGFLRSVLKLIDVNLDAPDHTTLSRRSQCLAVQRLRIPARGPIHLVVDSTGLAIVGEGEWAAVKHGRRGQRGWKKLHLDVDRSGAIVAQALTDATVDDATTGISLLASIDTDIARVTADAAYDTIAFYDAAESRGATIVVPPDKTGPVSRRRPRSSAQDRTITAVKAIKRCRWTKASGYHRQARVENAILRYKSIVGEALRARTPGGQEAEVLLACNVLNRMTEFGRPESYSIGP
jgi:IS5 family transposase